MHFSRAGLHMQNKQRQEVVLSQIPNGMERPIAYASRRLADTETHYASTKKELLRLVWAVRHIRCYLLGKKFSIRTDHRSLEHLANFKSPPAIVARWLEVLSQFEFDIVYRAERSYANTDALSRQPDPSSMPGVFFHYTANARWV
eukprot:scpid95342/ scgid16982/ Retrovirus-related Pol polyprotein from transposon 297; Protease; Reverse transcriptase; Endonuclease